MERPAPVVLTYGYPGAEYVLAEDFKKVVIEYLEYIQWLEIQLSFYEGEE